MVWAFRWPSNKSRKLSEIPHRPSSDCCMYFCTWVTVVDGQSWRKSRARIYQIRPSCPHVYNTTQQLDCHISMHWQRLKLRSVGMDIPSRRCISKCCLFILFYISIFFFFVEMGRNGMKAPKTGQATTAVWFRAAQTGHGRLCNQLKTLYGKNVEGSQRERNTCLRHNSI